MTIVCATNDNLPGVRPCTEAGAHRVTCRDHAASDGEGVCPGCLPLAAEVGFLCHRCYSLVEQAYAGWGRWSTLIVEAGDRAVTATGGGGSAALGYRATLEAGRQALIDRATALGMNADEAGALADQIFRIPSQTEWEIIAKTQAATSEVARFIADSEKQVIRIGVTTYAKDGPQGQLRISTPGAPSMFADGGVVSGGVRYYAGGGVESRVAQMARAGAVRVWAEPETEGETYLPHAKSKRATSEMYLAQTAALFGGKYIPASQANSPSPASGGGVVVNIAAINVPAGVTYAEAVSIAKEAVREGVRDALPGGSY